MDAIQIIFLAMLTMSSALIFILNSIRSVAVAPLYLSTNAGSRKRVQLIRR